MVSRGVRWKVEAARLRSWALNRRSGFRLAVRHVPLLLDTDAAEAEAVEFLREFAMVAPSSNRYERPSF